MKKKIFFEKFENWMVDQNSLTITYETAKHDEKNRKFSQKALWCCRALVHAWSSVLQCGKKQNCPTCKRKNQNRTIKVEQKVLISVVVTAQSKVHDELNPTLNFMAPHRLGQNFLPNLWGATKYEAVLAMLSWQICHFSFNTYSECPGIFW